LSNAEIIKELKKADLVATCPKCYNSFELANATLFDGLGDFPELAQQRKVQLLTELHDRLEQLKKRKISVGDAEQRAIKVGVGKTLEKLVPVHKDFTLPLPDCRPLFEPIDMIVFNGAHKFNVDSITFLEIKTGAAKANAHEKAIKHAVEDKKVIYKEVGK
jgi:predicted Holliday junction resolvase-like endonuclease